MLSAALTCTTVILRLCVGNSMQGNFVAAVLSTLRQYHSKACWLILPELVWLWVGAALLPTPAVERGATRNFTRSIEAGTMLRRCDVLGVCASAFCVWNLSRVIVASPSPKQCCCLLGPIPVCPCVKLLRRQHLCCSLVGVVYMQCGQCMGCCTVQVCRGGGCRVLGVATTAYLRCCIADVQDAVQSVF